MILPSSIFGGLELGRKICVSFFGNKAIMSPNGKRATKLPWGGKVTEYPWGILRLRIWAYKQIIFETGISETGGIRGNLPISNYKNFVTAYCRNQVSHALEIPKYWS